MAADGRTCKRCSRRYPVDLVESGQAFQRRGGEDASSPYKLVCRPCEDTAKDRRKAANREASKASDTRGGHAEKLAKPRKASGVEAWYDSRLTAAELEAVYGWDLAQMAHDIKFQYGNGCSYCHHPYKEMGHGLADITIDIFNPTLPPDYGTNTRWCCMTCQRRKGLLTPEKWAAKQRVYRLWEANKSLSPEDRGVLFDL